MQKAPIGSMIIFVIATPMRAAFADVMLDDLQKGLETIGSPSRVIRMSDASEIDGVWQTISEQSKGYDTVVGIDLNGNFNSPPVIDPERWRRFTILIDHPYFHAYKFSGYEFGLACSVVDQTHESALSDAGLEISAEFLPHAGPPPEPDVLCIAERQRDILFCGNIAEIVLPNKLAEKVGTFPMPVQQITLKTIERAITGEFTIHSALKRATSDILSEPLSAIPLETLSAVCKTVETYVAGRMRLELLANLLSENELKIDVVGRLRKPLEAYGINIESGGSIRYHDYLPFESVAKMMQATKINLNSNFTIRGGSHERIWHGIARGCATVTNESSFLRDEFGDGKGVLFIPQEIETIYDFLRETLTDTDNLDEIVAAASKRYASHHVWQHRAQELIELLNIET